MCIFTPKLEKTLSVLLAAVVLVGPIRAAASTLTSELETDASIVAEETAEADAEEIAGEQKEAKPKKWYRNVVPIPVIITEPAIGEGLGLAVAYFHPAKSPDAYQPKTIESAGSVHDVSVARKPPPTITGAFGAATNNGTWAGGVGHVNSFRNDTIRYTGIGAYANVIADFYVFNRPLEFNLEGIFISQDVKFRIAESNWFLGGALTYLDATNEFRVDIPELEPELANRDFLASDFRDLGLKGRVMYETRDDNMMPSTGQLFDLSVTRNDAGFGGDYNYTTLKAKMLSFHQLKKKFVLGLRADASLVYDDPPFYAVPWVTLRGIPAMRYQGEKVFVVEMEGRYNFNANWAVIGFAGKGWTSSDIIGIEKTDSARAWGLGGRYRFIKDQNVWVGIDLAKGPEDRYFYIQVGHPW